MNQNARVAHRTQARLAATLTLVDESRHAAQTLDLSHGGVSLQTASQLRLAQTCAVTFRVVIGASSHQVLAMGQVVYCDPDPDPAQGYKTGVQFLKIDADSATAIGRLLELEQTA
jgi:Tfp pilus assembly protein PilZ